MEKESGSKAFYIWFVKAAVAGVMALAIASLACLVYYNPPKAVIGSNGITDLTYKPNTFYGGFATEGASFGKIDKFGYMDNEVDIAEAELVILGSSHMEALQVFPKERVASLLKIATEMKVINFGVSGNTLLDCVRNLPSTLEIVAPKYLIIETASTMFPCDVIDNVLEETQNIDNSVTVQHRSRLYSLFQNVPYFRLVYKQFVGLSAPQKASQSSEREYDINDLVPCYDRLAAYIERNCANYNTQPIIFYQSPLYLDEDGTIRAKTEDTVKLWREACKAHNIIFVEMEQDFLALYDKNYVLPHGFSNTAIGAGHLNKYGHAAVAERLASVIAACEAANGGQQQ